MPEVGSEKSYWLKGDIFAKGDKSGSSGSAGFSFGFGSEPGGGGGGSGFSLLARHGSEAEDEEYR